MIPWTPNTHGLAILRYPHDLPWGMTLGALGAIACFNHFAFLALFVHGIAQPFLLSASIRGKGSVYLVERAASMKESFPAM
jgi:hypothetical protein